MLGHQTMESVIGPLGHSIPDIRFLTKTLLQTEPWNADPKVIRLPWRDDDEKNIAQKITSRTLTLGVLRNDGTVTPQPPVQRLLEEAVDKLKGRGYEVRRTSLLLLPACVCPCRCANTQGRYTGDRLGASSSL